MPSISFYNKRNHDACILITYVILLASLFLVLFGVIFALIYLFIIVPYLFHFS